MLHMIGHAIFGLIVGIIAKLIFPGHDPGGIIATMLLGIVGAWLGGLLGRTLGLYPPGHPAGFLMAVVGAILVLFIYHMAVGGARTRATVAPAGSVKTAFLMTTPRINRA